MPPNGTNTRHRRGDCWGLHTILQNKVQLDLRSHEEKFQQEHKAIVEIFKELGEENQKYYESLWLEYEKGET